MTENNTLFDILKNAGVISLNYSAREIGEVIAKLNTEKYYAQKREDEELRRKAQEERERREKEEKAKWEAHVQEVTCMDLPLDWENVFNSDVRTRGVHTESIPDAFIMSLSNLGRVDIEYIASITGEDYKTVISVLKGSIYQNPVNWKECFYKGWETAEEYLSGNLMNKWKAAKEANEKYNGYFADNIKAIEKVLPPVVTAEDIYITLGSPWVPTDIIDDFIKYLFGDPLKYWSHISDRERLLNSFKTIHDEITGTWEIPDKSRYNHSFGVQKVYGTERMEALHILERTLNMKAIAITDEVSCSTNASGKKRVINQAETVAALEKQQKLISAFQKWVWKDKDRKARLENIFNNQFACVRKRQFCGAFLDFPTMSPEVKLYPYQKDAVARIIFTPNTLLAHDVGSGKTYVMIAAGQELRRMGLSNKNMYVVPNNIVGQWREIFLKMYPTAKLLCVEPKNFTPKKREEVLKCIRDEVYDGIIIAYSCFEQIPISKEYYMETLKKEIEAISALCKKKGRSTASLTKRQINLDKLLTELFLSGNDPDNIIFFEELGINRLFIDEAHNFKNVPIETKAKTVHGINSTGSKKCKEMLDKVHMIQRMNDGKGVVMATGTPITNSITDVYIMQKYLQSGELSMLELQSFDSWIGMFAECANEFEIDVDTSSYRVVTRFSKFHNLPELTSLLAGVADFHQQDAFAELPEFSGYSDAVISKTSAFAMYLDKISKRADDVRQGYVNRMNDNMLKITTDGRKAALDMRLVDLSAGFTYQSKVARCVENVTDIYFKTQQEKSTQLIFCDTSTPKDGFNIYDEMKERLINQGISENQIVFIHDAETEAKRSQLFTKVRNGEVRILIGSTFKLGLGVNVQDKLIALHHLDVPWRPADMTQREGRILRQGNTNPQVYIYRYITEGSFDAYSWQLLETKQKFIEALLAGSYTGRSGTDIESTALDYAEVKALAVGNPLVKERVETMNALNRYLTLQHSYIENRIQMEKELLELPGRINNQKDSIRNCEEDLNFLYRQSAKTTEEEPISKAAQEKERQKIREDLGKAVRSHYLESREKQLFTYKGFDIILPANMIKEKPYIWLKREGKYYVELGDTDVGNLIRIDNYLATLEEHLEKLNVGLLKLVERQSQIEQELKKEEEYSDKIEQCKQKVEALDKKLGVDKK